MKTKLRIINLPESDECEKDLREKVKIKQIKIKEYTDKRRSALHTNFQPGSKVRVKKLWMSDEKDGTKYLPAPLQTLFLWKSWMRHCESLLHPPPSIRASRPRTPPSWMKDFVT